MNASLWQLAGWTMIHSLWLGAAVALVGGFLRLAARRAAPNTRYAISLGALALLAATPIATAGWLSVNGVPVVESILLPLPTGDGTKRARSPVATERSAVARAQHWGEGQTQVRVLNPPSLTLPLKGSEPEVGSESSRPAIIDLAQATPAELDALAAQQQSPQAIPTNTPAPLPLPPSPLPLHPSDHRSPITSHIYSLIPHLPTLWLIGAPLTFTLLATGLVGSERLRRRATPLTAGPAFDACQRLRQTLNITRRVALAACDDVAQPILVGIVRPLILLPTAALAGWTPEQLDMVLLHELAHVRRWDNLVNLLQRIVESLLFFHPAVWLVSRQVRRDREECCDAAVIRHTDRPHQYAELLVSIAAALRGGPAPSLAVASAMASHPLAGRIRRILNIEAEPMRITRRTLAATLLLPLLLAGAIFYSGASAEDSPPVKAGSPGSPNQGGAATGSNTDKTQLSPNASSGSAAPVQEPEPSAKSGENETAPENDADSYAANYPISPDTQIDLFDLVRSLGGHNLKLDMVAGEWVISLNATKQAHNRLKVLLGDPTLPQPAAAPSSNMAATAPSRLNDDLNASVDIANLQKEIRNLTNLIAKAQKEIIDSEVAKELAIRSVGSPATIEAAVNAELERDSTIGMYKSQLFELTSQLKIKSSTAKNADDVELKRLRSAIQQTEAQAAQYRSEAERALRDKLAKTANDRLSAEIAEHQMRRMGAEVELTEYQQQLLHYKQQLAEANAHLGVPQAIGTYATPTIAAAEAVERQISDKKQPAQTTILDALDNAKSPAEQQEAFKQLAAVFAPSDANPPMAVIYDAPPGDNMRERIEGIFEGFEKDPYGPQISSSTRRWLNDDRNIEITAPRRAHDLYLHDLFLHLNFFAQISDAIAEPLPTDEQATGEAGPNPQHESDAFPISSKVGHEALAAVIADAQRRLERQLAELKQRTAGREETEAELAMAAALKGKIIRLQVLEANRQTMQTKRREDAGAPSSLNLHAAAIESDVNDALRNANAAAGSAKFALTAPLPAEATAISSEIARLESQVTQSKKEIAQLTVFDQLARILGNPRPHIEHVIRDVAQLDPAVETSNKQLDAVNEKLRSLANGTVPLDDHEVRQLQRQRQEATEQLTNAREQFVKEQIALLSRLSDEELRKTTTERRRRLDEASKELATYQLDLKLATMLAGGPDSPNQGAAAPESNDNAQTTTKAPPSAANLASDFDAISVIQYPTSQKSSIFDGTVTTAYLKVKFDRLRYSVDAPNGRLSPQEIESNSMNCLAIIKSPAVLKAALKSFTPQAAQDMWQDQAVEWLQKRLSATFPGDGEILELKLEGGDAKEDAVLLQAVIDAFLTAMKAPPKSPADPNSTTGAATVPPGDLTPYMRRDVNVASTVSDYEHPDVFLRSLERSRESDKPVVVHILSHNSDPSEQFANNILAYPQVADFIDKNFDAITIYADDEPAFAKTFHVNRVPVDMFVFAGGELRTGCVTPPSTPELYLAHLKTHHKLATTPELQNGNAPLVSEAAIAPAADRPGDDNQAFEHPPSHVEGLKLLKEFPATINPDELRAGVEGYRQEGNDVWVERLPESNAIRVLVASKAAAAQPAAQQPTFLYDGKTFDQWRDLWKLELNPERRIEAISAMAAFSRAGRGDEAVSAILDVAAEYDFNRIDDSKPEGRLKECIIEALAPDDVASAVDQWLPMLLNRLKSDPQKWDQLLLQLLARTGPPYRESFALSPENLKLLKQAAADPAYGPNAKLANHLYWSAPEDKEVAQLIKATLAGKDAANAVELLRNIGYRRVDEFPEKLELLFHSDPAIRRLARTALYHSLDPGTHDAVAAKLLAVVADPKQADRHADAIRAIAAIVKRAGDKPNPEHPTLSNETIQAIVDGLIPILADGSAELIPPAFLVAVEMRATANYKNKLVDFLSNPPEERMAPVEAALKASPDEEAALIDQPDHGGGMDGPGGGFF